MATERCYNCYYSGAMNPEEEHPEFTDPLYCRKPIEPTSVVWPKIWPIVESTFSCLNFRRKLNMDQYTIPFMMSGGQAGGASLSRNSTYYFGMHASLTFGPQGTEDVSKIYVPCNCTLRRAYGNIYCSSPGSETLGATMYIKIGSIGDVTIATDIKFNQTNTAVAAQDLDTEIGSGNYVTGKIVTPNWTGGVTGVRIEILGLFD